MKLILLREESRNEFTPGELLLNGTHFCWTLEDQIREVKGVSPVEWKVFGKTAIPEGTYRVILNWSNRFKRQMIEILNVPGFAGIRIHNGQTEKNTDGCILVHYKRAEDLRLKDYDKTAMYDIETAVLKALTGKEQISIEIRNKQKEQTDARVNA